MDPSRLERIRKRREEDDEEFMFLLLPLLRSRLMGNRGRMERRQRHSSVLYGKRRVEEILDGHVKNCRVAFRMEPHIFRSIASYLRTEKLLKDKRIKVEEKLAFFLYMLSHNASFEKLQLEFQHSNRSFHKCIKEFFDIIPVLSNRFLKLPNIDQPHPKIATDSRFFPYFQNCIGAIDGSHVPVSVSPHLAAPFRNRKGTLSHNVMIACDFDLNVTYISAGWEGSTTDARVLRSAKNTGFKVPNGKFYLVDGGYANTPSFLAPYRGVRYHLKEFGHGRHRPQNYKELFNHRHALMRNHVERTLGVLKKRFPILRVATYHRMRNQVKIPAAAAILHNIIRMHHGDEEWLEHQEDNIPPATFVDLPNGDDNHQGNNHAGNAFRDQIAMEMFKIVKASKVFKIAGNRETFLSWAAEDEQSAIMWLRDELAELP